MNGEAKDGSRTHPDSGLRDVGPHGDLLAGAHVGVAVAREERLQLLQLLRGEVRALPPLPLVLVLLRLGRVQLRVGVVRVLGALLLLLLPAVLLLLARVRLCKEIGSPVSF